MKTLILLTLCAIMTIGCNDKTKTIDPYTRMVVNPDKSLTKAMPNAPYSADTIVRYAMEMNLLRNLNRDPNFKARRGFGHYDLVTKKIKIGELTDVVEFSAGVPVGLGWLVTDDTREFTLVAWRDITETKWMDAYANKMLNIVADKPGLMRDTIGYIPSAVLNKAKADIKEAFNAEDYDLCSALFEEAFTFLPITGEQWREKKANGTL